MGSDLISPLETTGLWSHVTNVAMLSEISLSFAQCTDLLPLSNYGTWVKSLSRSYHTVILLSMSSLVFTIILLSMNSLVFILEIFTEQLLCAHICARYWGYSDEGGRRNS